MSYTERFCKRHFRLADAKVDLSRPVRGSHQIYIYDWAKFRSGLNESVRLRVYNWLNDTQVVRQYVINYVINSAARLCSVFSGLIGLKMLISNLTLSHLLTHLKQIIFENILAKVEMAHIDLFNSIQYWDFHL